jgi:oligopeptide transport system substrate-binding protein
VNKVKNRAICRRTASPPYTDGAKLTEPEWFKQTQEQRNAEAKKLLAERATPQISR